MAIKKSLWMSGSLCLLLAMPISATAQDDNFSDELEAELEAEIGIGEEETAEENDFVEVDDEEYEEEAVQESDDKGFEDEDLTEDSREDTNDLADEDFSDEEFSDQELSDEDFDEESFAGEEVSDDDFSDEEFAEDSFEGDQTPTEQNVGDPLEENFEDPLEEAGAATDVLESEPEAKEEVSQEMVAEPDEQVTSRGFGEAGASNYASPTEPNLEYEAKLYSIYKNYHSSPVPNAEWQNLLGSRKAEVYSIEKGDSLWGISETFFGDGNYWPKVWSINSKIENPHLIQPANQIQFVMGTEDAAPMFTVTEAASPEQGGEASVGTELQEKDVEKLVEAGALSAEDTEKLREIIESDLEESLTPTPVLEADSSMDIVNEETEELEPDIEIPPPGVVSRPVLRKLPPSVPEWQGRSEGGTYDDLGISYGVRPITRLKDSAYLLSFVDDKESTADAIVMETEKGGYYGSDLDYIYVKVPKGKGQTGDEYLVVRSHGRIRPSMISIRTSDLGYQKQIAGLIRLGKRVKADVDEDDFEAFRARVVKSVNPIRLGSQLVKGSLPTIDLSESGPRSNIVAQIIGGTGGKTRAVFGKGSIVYINRGRKEGVRVGQVMQLRSHKLNRFKKTKILEHNRVIGKIKIVKVVERFATAVVLDSDDMIFAGDLTGEGEYLYRRWGGVSTADSSAYIQQDPADQIEADADDSSEDELDQLLNEESDLDDF